MGAARRTDSGLLDDCAPGGGDAASEKTDAVERCLRVDGHDGDVRDDGVLGER